MALRGDHKEATHLAGAQQRLRECHSTGGSLRRTCPSFGNPWVHSHIPSTPSGFLEGLLGSVGNSPDSLPLTPAGHVCWVPVAQWCPFFFFFGGGRVNQPENRGKKGGEQKRTPILFFPMEIHWASKVPLTPSPSPELLSNEHPFPRF